MLPQLNALREQQEPLLCKVPVNSPLNRLQDISSLVLQLSWMESHRDLYQDQRTMRLQTAPWLKRRKAFPIQRADCLPLSVISYESRAFRQRQRPRRPSKAGRFFSQLYSFYCLCHPGALVGEGRPMDKEKKWKRSRTEGGGGGSGSFPRLLRSC